MVNARFGGHAIPAPALVVAPALMAIAIILFTGTVSGAPRPHPRRDFARSVPAYPQIMVGVWFPRLAARDLGRREVILPAGLPGERNVVLIAFRRDQQRLVDSWVPWLEQRVATDPELRFVELPAIGLQWEPARRAIDGGIAAAIRDEAVRGRTLTVYTDLRRVTIPLAIGDRSAIWLSLVDRAGRVAWRASGGLDPVTAAALDTALATPPESAASAPAQAAGPGAEQFEMAFDPGSGCHWPRSG
jgi:hypothetical protein